MIQTNALVGVLLAALLLLMGQRGQQQPHWRTITPWTRSRRSLVSPTPVRRQRLPIRVSRRQMAMRSETEVAQWRMADTACNVARSLHPRWLCDRGRIQDDRLLWRDDRARHECPHV